jgi:hypothetical protein
MNSLSIFRTAAVALSLAAAAQAESFNHVGLGLKTGESTGLLGLQLSANITKDVQLNAGWGTSALTIDQTDKMQVRSIFAAAKYYYGGWYASTGYTRKEVSVETEVDGRTYSDSKAEHGIPLHIGYEFGGRTGFYTTVSAGFLTILGGGGEKLIAGTPQTNVGTTTTESGLSLGLGIGYYLF